ncbi:MAG: dimethyl sulfoxide reductase anchor subunit [Chthoniobacterales bacterium]|nr:dimethyl sulfoxide reductase anchor subunit [Chthoniobacterales bacterium]
MIVQESNLIDRLLAEQRQLTAVERFSQKHEREMLPLQAHHYRDLIPFSQPAPGQQYAFEVNLDKCTGCKACVSACHSLNGLEDHETWRDVGTLVGYDRGKAYQQTVTTACHHCAEPGCLEGCPVMAYEKDATTGIVRHLDDQCIGCQYCTMKCPYDVPKYSDRLGIVRKCDMCHDRLAVGEAPACVQACPHEAITIRLVDVAEVSIASARPDERLLPGTYDSAYTKPTTRFVSSRPIPRDADAASAQRLRKEHAHWPLLVMLVLTQLATGMLFFLGVVAFADSAAFPRIHFPIAAAAFGLLNVGLLAAVFHLGRPLGAWRFFLGLRTSWMSREILAFSGFAGLAAPAVAVAWLFPSFPWLIPVVALTGLGAVFTSAMIYIDTRRYFWTPELVGGRFFGSVFTLGAGATLACGGPAWLAGVTMGLLFVTFAWEMSRHHDALQDSDARTHSSARIVDTLMPRLVPARGVLFLAALSCLAAELAVPGVGWALAALGTLLAGAVLERYVFFTAVVPHRMPGGFIR